MTDEELEQAAQQAAEARLLRLAMELMDGEDDEDTVASAPFCGCETCITRECLDAAWPFIFERARREAGHAA